MAIIPGKFCEDCELDGDQTPATEEWNARHVDSGGLFLCDRHADGRRDGYYERKFEDYWGASTPQTLQEQYDAAAKQKRELD